ncbi:MAG: hypothetical protein CVU44_15570, partial [Chloroflexi bacterium HGW-Chloroflexi-6]
MKNKFFTLLVLLAILLALLPNQAALAAGNILYVDIDSTCIAFCGGSWATAYPNLQTALSAATSGKQIWVAEGIYLPGVDRTSTFTLKNNVAIYGGFNGTESRLDQRDSIANPTILSGDIDQNDTNADKNFIAETSADIQGSNAYHVVTGGGTNNTAVLDGFILTAGQANSTTPNDGGGGIVNPGGNPILRYVTFSGNSATVNGGGMYNSGSSNPTLTNVTFSGNTASYGGGMRNDGSSPSLNSVTFTNNIASGNGGGMFNYGSSPMLTNVTFSANSSIYGGGMHNYEASSPVLTNVTFSGNTASFGAGMQNSGSNPTLTNVTFSNNICEDLGGGMRNDSSSPTLTDVTFNGNSASSGGGMFNSDSNPVLTNVTLSANSASFGGGMHNINSNPALTNVTFSSNSATHEGGGMRNSSGSPTLTNVTFSGNSAAVDGGGIYNENNSSPTLMNVTFSANEAISHGGGMANSTSSNPTLTNVTFSGANDALYGGGISNNASSPVLTNVTFSANSASFGGGMSNTSSSNPTLTNVTFSSNTTTSHGGGMWNYASSNPQIRNTVFWGNTADNAGAQIFNLDSGSGSPTLSDSIVQNGCPTGTTCTNITTTDPLLGTLGNYGGFTQTIPILAGSSAIDKGNNATCADTDQRGIARPQGESCDIGSFEVELATVLSITRAGTSSTSAASVDFNISFSEPVDNVHENDFHVTVTGTISGAVVTGITGDNTNGTVTVSTGTGTGTIRLDILPGVGIVDMDGYPLGGLPYTSGEVYSVRAQTFADVPVSYWAWNYVERLYDAGITGGCSTNPTLIYCPENSVTRAQMAIFIERGMNGSAFAPPPASGTVFGDVAASYWAAAWVEQLASDNITGGCGNGNYC